MPQSRTRSTSNAISFPAVRSQRRSVSELAGGDCGLNKSRALRLSFGRSQVHVTTPLRVFHGASSAMSIIYFLIILALSWLFYTLMMKNEET